MHLHWTWRLVEEMVQKACLSISDARFPFGELSKEAERILLATKSFTPVQTAGWTHAVFAIDHLFGFCDVYTREIQRKPWIRNCVKDFIFSERGRFEIVTVFDVEIVLSELSKSEKLQIHWEWQLCWNMMCILPTYHLWLICARLYLAARCSQSWMSYPGTLCWTGVNMFKNDDSIIFDWLLSLGYPCAFPLCAEEECKTCLGQWRRVPVYNIYHIVMFIHMFV